MKTVLAYMIPMDDWKTYGANAARFTEMYRLYPPQVDHELLIVCCNGPITAQITSLFKGIPATFDNYYGTGWDCGAAQATAKKIDCDFLVTANSSVYFRRPGWLRRLVAVRIEHGEGLYGAMASYESLPYVAGEVNPHIRTSFYGCSPHAFRQFPFTIDSREKCFKFECGSWNFARWFEERGKRCLMVTWDGCYGKQEFRTPANVFRKGDQNNLIIRDRHTDVYDMADSQLRAELELRADGGLPSLNACIGLPASITGDRDDAATGRNRAPVKAQLPSFEPNRSAAANLAEADVLAADQRPERLLVSIGMPVYNGEQYLALALESLLQQDYPHFEVIISDNASLDRTEEICRKFAQRDPRIRYIRQLQNQGMPWNFAHVVQEAKGEYFMWASHDDLFHHSYIGKCLEKLAAHPGAVFCCTEVNFIDAEGRPHSDWSNKNYKNIDTLGMTPPQRIHELISRMGWFATYGLARLENVKKLSLGLDTYGFDVVLIEELLLLGDFVKIHEPLFSYRMAKYKSVEDFQADFNSEQSVRSATKTPYADLATDLLQTAYRSPLSDKDKVKIFADFVFTLTLHNPWWRKSITIEILGEEVALPDSAFALLLAAMLSRSVPLGAMKSNPLIGALSGMACGKTDLLKVAELHRTRPGGLPLSDCHKEAIRLFAEENFEESSRLFDDVLLQQESSELWSDWASVQLACNRAADGERGLRRALALDADNDLAALKLGVLLATLDRNGEATSYLERCAAKATEPERSEIQQLLADCRSKLAYAVRR